MRVRVVEWLIYFALWVAFVGKFTPGELALGACAAALGVAGTSMSRRAELRQFRGVGWLRHAWRLIGDVLVDTAIVLRTLARHLFTRRKAESLLQSVPFAFLGSDDRSAMRRALATVLTSVSPNIIVIDVDRDSGLLVFHQLQRRAVPRLTIELGARP